MTRADAEEVLRRAAVTLTGYETPEAAAWARGVVDALTLDRPTYFAAFTMPMVEQLAERLALL